MKTLENKEPPVPILIYARTSDEDSFCGSIEEQLAALRYWAKFNNCDIEREYKDENVSGLHKRPPGLKKLIDDLEHGELWARYVVVCEFSRITRNLNVYDWYKYSILMHGSNTISLSESCTSIPELLDHEGKFNFQGTVVD